MKKNFDFVISADKDCDKIVLRFYPKHSHVHGFGEEAPNSWDRVYKTYMSFAILKYCFNSKKQTYDSTNILFENYGDEGEGLRILRDVLNDILVGEHKEYYEITPFGYGVDWEVRDKRKNFNYDFTMIDNLSNKAFRFVLNKEKIQEFYNVLNEFLEYMLSNSEGI